MFKQKPTKKQIAALVFSFLLPALGILFSIVWTLKPDTIPSMSVFMFSFLIPLVVSVFILLVFSSKVKTWIKTILIILLLLIVLFSWGLFLFIGQMEYLQVISPEETENNETFSHLYADILPFVNDVENAEKTEIYYYENYYFIFETHVIYLVCTYDAEEYTRQKDIINQSYSFTDTNPQAYYASHYSFLKGNIDNYQFRPLAFDSYENLEYPKSMAYIITNDATSQIIYMSFYDADIDYIENDGITDFINESCGWEHVVKKIQSK